MRNKRIRLAALAAALALVLAGCSLAQPERQEKQADRFEGSFWSAPRTGCGTR